MVAEILFNLIFFLSFVILIVLSDGSHYCNTVPFIKINNKMIYFMQNDYIA